MGKEVYQPSEQDVRRTNIIGFVEQAMSDPKLILMKAARIELPSVYKTVAIDTAVEISFLSDDQVREEAKKLDTWAQDSGYALNPANQWKPLIDQSKEHEDLVLSIRKGHLPESEIQSVVNTLLKQRVIKRKIEKGLSAAEYAGDFRKDPTKTALATNICIHAVYNLQNK